MAKITKVVGLMIKLLVLDDFTTLMAQCMRVNGLMENDMEWGS